MFSTRRKEAFFGMEKWGNERWCAKERKAIDCSSEESSFARRRTAISLRSQRERGRMTNGSVPVVGTLIDLTSLLSYCPYCSLTFLTYSFSIYRLPSIRLRKISCNKMWLHPLFFFLSFHPTDSNCLLIIKRDSRQRVCYRVCKRTKKKKSDEEKWDDTSE